MFEFIFSNAVIVYVDDEDVFTAEEKAICYINKAFFALPGKRPWVVRIYYDGALIDLDPDFDLDLIPEETFEVYL